MDEQFYSQTLEAAMAIIDAQYPGLPEPERLAAAENADKYNDWRDQGIEWLLDYSSSLGAAYDA